MGPSAETPAGSNGCGRANDLAGAQGSTVGRGFDRFYDELRALAGYHLSFERDDHTLQPTALVHEAYLRIFDHPSPPCQNRTKFLFVASQMIRRILVDHARRHNAVKRSGRWKRFILDEISLPETGEAAFDILDVDDAIQELARLSPRQARVVELRFFGGLAVAETAEALGVSKSSVKGDWRIARAWLRVRLGR